MIQSAPGGQEALIKGSDVVTGWKKAGPGLFVKDAWSVRSEQVFVDGKPLAQIGGTGVFVRHSPTVDDIIGRVLSQSISSSEKLGDRLGPFETELRAALAELSPDGHFTEIADIRATIARRP